MFTRDRYKLYGAGSYSFNYHRFVFTWGGTRGKLASLCTADECSQWDLVPYSNVFLIRSVIFKEWLYADAGLGRNFVLTNLASPGSPRSPDDRSMQWEIVDYGAYFGIKNVKIGQWMYAGRDHMSDYGGSPNKRFVLTRKEQNTPAVDSRWLILNHTEVSESSADAAALKDGTSIANLYNAGKQYVEQLPEQPAPEEQEDRVVMVASTTPAWGQLGLTRGEFMSFVMGFVFIPTMVYYFIKRRSNHINAPPLLG